MNVLDLFSGIGGFSIGLERAGMRTVAFCETEPFCRAVLAKHWPGVPCYEDVRTLTADRLARDGISVDVICGGFPCQDISHAGKGAGLAGERSGLWYEFHRLIEEIKPRYAIIENVSALRSRGLDAVLGSLAAIGYDAEWHCIPASAVGAPHRRDRIWITAYRNADNESQSIIAIDDEASRMQGDVADANSSLEANGGKCSDFASQSIGWRNDGTRGNINAREVSLRGARINPEIMADAYEQGLEGWNGNIMQECSCELSAGPGRSRWVSEFWSVEPGMGRVADGIPARMDRLKALGNAVVPQIPEIIGKAVMSHALRNA